VTKRRARIYDGLALLLAVLVVTADQWTKALVVAHLSPPGFGPQVSIVGQYLILYYIQNNGAAFSLFANSVVLIALILAAIALVAYLYARMLNDGSLPSKLVFGLIIGGALGNLIDRARHGNNVIDFISFRIPQIGFYFAIFNIADAAISVGVVLLFLMLLFGGLRRTTKVSSPASPSDAGTDNQNTAASTDSGKGAGNTGQRSTPRS
jgi:signal peptidase II